MASRILAALLVSACGGPPAPPQDLVSSEPVSVSADPLAEETPSETAPRRGDGCGSSNAHFAVGHMMPPGNDGIVRVARFESEGHPFVALLGAAAPAADEPESVTLLLYVGECVNEGWRFWDPAIPIGTIPRSAGEGPSRYERADVQLSSVEISAESRAVQIEWRHAPGPPSGHSVERRTVRWYELRVAGPTLLAECTTRDLRSIDASSFVQGHELVRGWRILPGNPPGNPPRLVGERVAGGGALRGRAMVWSDVSDQRTLDVSLRPDPDPELREICL